MSDITSCYANWRIDFTLLLGILALLLLSGESQTLLTNLTGAILLVADLLIARHWRKSGKLSELDKIAE